MRYFNTRYACRMSERMTLNQWQKALLGACIYTLIGICMHW